MDNHNPDTFDCAVIGGGLSGLSLAINLGLAGSRVILFEKERYPFHRVCGEYVSMESWPYLEKLGLPLRNWGLPFIRELVVSTPGGSLVRQELSLGGFGISRFKLDHSLAQKAREVGVCLLEQTKVLDVIWDEQGFSLQTSGGTFRARVTAGAWGKRSNLDIRWKRHLPPKGKSMNYLAVKYHVRGNHPSGTIFLHLFRGGYCGYSAVEGGISCLCYLIRQDMLPQKQPSIPRLEQIIQDQNPYIRELFSSSEFLLERPLSVSNLSFNSRSLLEKRILMTGDAAGLLAPLCGNGMSMALHSGKIGASLILDFLEGRVSRSAMESGYEKGWKKNFSGRMKAGHLLQKVMERPAWFNLLLIILRPFPGLLNLLIRTTHGQPF